MTDTSDFIEEKIFSPEVGGLMKEYNQCSLVDLLRDVGEEYAQYFQIGTNHTVDLRPEIISKEFCPEEGSHDYKTLMDDAIDKSDTMFEIDQLNTIFVMG